MEIYRGRKNKWAIAAELQNRSVWVSLSVFDTSRSVNTVLRGADRIYVQYFDAEWCQNILATYVDYTRQRSPGSDLGPIIWEIRNSLANRAALATGSA